MPTIRAVNGTSSPRSTAPTSAVGSPDVIWGLPGQGGMLSEWSESVPDLMWPESVRTYGRMRRDGRLKAILSGFTLPILRTTWAVDPEGIDNAAAVDLVAGDLGLPILNEKGRVGESTIPGFRWHEHARLALLNLVYGFMPFEKWFEVRGGLTHLAGVQERQPHTVASIDVNADGSVNQVFQNTQLNPIAANRLCWYVNEREGANWTGTSLMRACYTPWVLKHETMRVHATSIRRFGMGVPSVSAPASATPGQIQQAQQLAAGMRVGDTAGAGLPDGFEFKLTGLTGSVPDALGFLEWCNQEMTTSALAQIVELGQSKTGSRAVGETFLDLFLLSLQAVADSVGDTATIGSPGMNGLAKDLVEYNWGEGEPVPRIVATDVGDRHEITAMAIMQLVQSGALAPDPSLDAFIREAWGLPERQANFPMPAAPGATQTPPGGGGSPSPDGGPAQPAPGSGGAGSDQEGGVAPAATRKRARSLLPARPARARRADRNWLGRILTSKAAGPDGLRRQLTKVEAAAGFDPVSLRTSLDSAKDKLLNAWAPVLRAQRLDLTDQVQTAVESGNLANLAKLAAPAATGPDVLKAAMVDMATAAARQVLTEAASQGVMVNLADVAIDETRLGQVATARAALAGAYTAQQASAKALRVVQAAAGKVRAAGPDDPNSDGITAAQEVRTFLEGLSPTPLADQLNGALMAAANAGRGSAFDTATTEAAEMGLVPVYFASEILDQNTCEPCAQVDGYQFQDLTEADSQYVNGGYIDCLGDLRCRGTFVAQWRSQGEALTGQEATTD